MKKGHITLYNRKGTEIVTRLYSSAKEREKILLGWKQLYGKMFMTMFYHIVPQIQEPSIYEQNIKEMVELHRKGWPYKLIGPRFGVSDVTARTYIRKYINAA